MEIAIADLVVPEVNKELLAELEGMGFSTARATRSLHFSGMKADSGHDTYTSKRLLVSK